MLYTFVPNEPFANLLEISPENHIFLKIFHSEFQEINYVKGHGFLSFAKNISKNISNKYSQKLVDRAKKSATDAIKTALEKAI